MIYPLYLIILLTPIQIYPIHSNVFSLIQGGGGGISPVRGS